MNQPFVLKALEVLAGIISLVSLKWKFTPNNTKDLIQELDKKNNEIIRLTVEIEGWKMHHKKLARGNHLHK